MRSRIPLALLVLPLALSCGGGDGPAPLAPEFQLLDVNDTSDSFNQLVSPRQYEGFVAAVYFGSAT